VMFGVGHYIKCKFGVNFFKIFLPLLASFIFLFRFCLFELVNLHFLICHMCANLSF